MVLEKSALYSDDLRYLGSKHDKCCPRDQMAPNEPQRLGRTIAGDDRRAAPFVGQAEP